MSEDPFVTTLQEWIEVLMRYSMRNFLHHARQSGLSMSHLGAIFYIHRFGSCGVTEIGEHLGVTSAAASQMLERMVQQGLVLRAEDSEDRRVKRIELTEKGHEIFEEGIRARQSWLNNLAGTLTESEKHALTCDLKILIDKINQLSHETVSIP
jgi:DNA-binding MarR family transcriptional regulator